HDLVRQNTPQPFAVIADARRESWHVVEVSRPEKVEPLKRASSVELTAFSGSFWAPRTFRTWSAPPRETQPCDYDLAALLAANRSTPLFARTDSPDAFQHDAPSYKKWSAQIHRATAGTK